MSGLRAACEIGITFCVAFRIFSLCLCGPSLGSLVSSCVPVHAERWTHDSKLRLGANE